jgi:hypothetical protein
MIANVAAADTYLNWCGKEWWVRSGTGNPGGNNWNDSSHSVWVDANQNLHLTIRKVGDTWYSTEVDTTSADYKYGVYTWKVSSPILNLDPNIVSAMFFRHNDTNEIDIEATQWGWIYSDRLSCTVQPNAYQSAISYDSSYQNATDVTYQFDWEPAYVHFIAKLADGTIIADVNCTDQTSIPHVAGGVAMQMWLMSHLAPINGQNAEMVLSNFSYVPSDANSIENTSVTSITSTSINSLSSASINSIDNSSVNTTDNSSVNTTDNSSVNTTDNSSVNTTDNSSVNTTSSVSSTSIKSVSVHKHGKR